VSVDCSSEIISLLADRGETFAAAESCTGGGIVARLTGVPGSSKVVWGGIVSYADEAKITLLDVDSGLLERDGSVSSGVAKSMAWGVRVRSSADWTVAVTGIAGPGGGSPEKPVGTVWIAWSTAKQKISAELFHFKGDRDDVRRQTEEKALVGLLELIAKDS
jgi:PncC family amidohydrolase